MPSIDFSKFEEYWGRGLLKRQIHPDLPLLIWSYTEHCQYGRIWDDVTLQCRGLITDTEGKIIARAFNKFFNDNEKRHEPTEEWVMYEKLDGSLGILFFYEDAWKFASKGSFQSPQVPLLPSEDLQLPVFRLARLGSGREAYDTELAS